MQERSLVRFGMTIFTTLFLVGTTSAASLPLKLEIVAPETNGRSVLFTTQWPLTLKLEIPTSVAIISTIEGGLGRRSAWVYDDPDGCLDARTFRITGALPFEEGCKGPDEKWVEVTNERDDIDFAGFDKNGKPAGFDKNGNFQIREELKDDAFGSTGDLLLNIQYYLDDKAKAKKMQRPKTGGDFEDGLGWGADDDWPGLVVMSDTGAAKVLDFDLRKPKGMQYIRNMAGLMQGVTSELLDSSGNTTVTGHTQVLAGMFEPVVVVDLNLDPNGPYGGFDFVRSVDGGEPKGFNTDIDIVPNNQNAITSVLLQTVSPVNIGLKTVVVEGTAPDFVADMDGNGQFNQADLVMMGYTPISNEASRKIRLEFDAVINLPADGINCPHRNLIYLDLDGNGDNGDPLCSGTSSSRKSTRVPR